MLESKFVKFLSILKWQVKSFSNFASFFIARTHNSSRNFKLKHFLLWTKWSHQTPNFNAFKWSGENLSNYLHYFPNHRSVFLQIFHHSPVSWKITPLYFLAQTIYTLFKKRPLIKWKFLRLSNAQVKICQIPLVNFETTSRFLSKFCIALQCHER